MNPLKEIKKEVESITEVPTPIRRPPSGMGDVAFPAGFVMSKKVGGDPKKLAEEVAGSLSHPLVQRAEATGGYVNVYLNRVALVEKLWEDAVSQRFGSSSGGKTFVIDYSSPNIAKPMHVGHLRSTVIGESLKRILIHRGQRVVGLNYLGDIGTQFGALIAAYRRWVDERALQEDPIKELLRLYVKFHKEVEEDPSLEEEARKELERLESGDPENVALWRRFRELSLRGFQRVYDRLGVSFDMVVGESDFVEEARRLSQELLERGLAKVATEGSKKGAIVADLESEGLDHPVLLKSDGTTLYLSRDLASLLWRIKEFSPDVLVYVVAIEQNLHFKQLFTLARKMGVDRQLIHLAFGMVHVEGMRLSTRRGQVVFLEDILSESVSRVGEEMKTRGTYDPSEAEKIGVSAVNFWMLKAEPKKDVLFRWKDVTDFRGESGPYVQYAYVRAKNILARGPSSYLEEPDDAEWEIIKEVAWFPLVLEEVERRLSPHILARYLLELSSLFHSFYDHHRVVGHPREGIRTWMVSSVKNVLEIGQRLLVMKPPSVM